MPRPLKVFLCHASQDKPIVRELYQRLKAENWIDPWLDKAKLLPGQDWELVIEKAVDDSDVVIVCLSSQSVSKEGFVQREIRYAYDLALEKPEDTIFLIPLRLDDCNVPRKLRTLHWVDYFESQEQKDKAVSDLLESLKLRHDQLLRLEAMELERWRLEEKARQEAEELVRKIAIEKSEREKTERKKADREKAEHEKAEHETDEKKKRKEKIEQENAKRIAREKAMRANAKRQKPKESVSKSVSTKEQVSNPNPKFTSQPLVAGGVILIALFLFGLIALLNNKPTQNTPTQSAVTTHTIYANTLPVYTPTKITTTPIFLSQTPTQTEILPTNTELEAVSSSTPSKPLPQRIVDKSGVTMLLVSAGEFIMGSDKNSFSVQYPAHTVFLDAYYIDKFEVTNEQFKICVDKGICTRDFSCDLNDFYRNSSQPVVCVTWTQAKSYCEWRGARLPTEAEWEKAARGTDGRIYAWGNDFDPLKANFYYWDNNDNYISDNYRSMTAGATFSYDLSPFGLYDMTGNVSEWVSDWYSELYYTNSPYENPQGPDSGDEKIFKGGNWNFHINESEVGWLSLSFRLGWDPNEGYQEVGFRCALSQP